MVGLTSGQVLVVLAPVAIAALVLCLLVVRFTAGVTAGAEAAPAAISPHHAHA